MPVPQREGPAHGREDRARPLRRPAHHRRDRATSTGRPAGCSPRTAGCCSPRAATPPASPRSTRRASTPSRCHRPEDVDGRPSRPTDHRRASRRGAAAPRQRGPALLHDIDIYVKGINARLRPRRARRSLTRTDVYAVNALDGQFFGQGGGDEARRSSCSAGCRSGSAPTGPDASGRPRRARRPPTRRRRSRRFPYEEVPAQRDRQRRSSTDGSHRPRRRQRARRPRGARPAHASNFLMVSRQPLDERPPAVRRRARRSATSTPA